MGFGLVSAINN